MSLFEQPLDEEQSLGMESINESDQGLYISYKLGDISRKDYLTELGISESTYYKDIRANRIPHRRKPHRQLFRAKYLNDAQQDVLMRYIQYRSFHLVSSLEIRTVAQMIAEKPAAPSRSWYNKFIKSFHKFNESYQPPQTSDELIRESRMRIERGINMLSDNTLYYFPLTAFPDYLDVNNINEYEIREFIEKLQEHPLQDAGIPEVHWGYTLLTFYRENKKFETWFSSLAVKAEERIERIKLARSEKRKLDKLAWKKEANHNYLFDT